MCETDADAEVDTCECRDSPAVLTLHAQHAYDGATMAVTIAVLSIKPPSNE